MSALPVENLAYGKRERMSQGRALRAVPDGLLQQSVQLPNRHVKVRQSVRPDQPRTYADTQLRSVPPLKPAARTSLANRGVYIGKRNPLERDAVRMRPAAVTQRRAAVTAYGSVSDVSRPARHTAELTHSVVATAFSAPMRWVLGAGVIIGMLGVVFAVGLQTALSVGLVG